MSCVWPFISLSAAMDECILVQKKIKPTLECQIEGQACVFIFHFLLTWPKLIWPYPFIFSGVIWKPVVWQANWNHKRCEGWLFYLPFMGTLSFDFLIYGCHYSHTAWRKPIFIESCCFCKRIKPKIICNPDLIFGLAEHLVTLTLYTTLPLYHLEEMCHLELIFWPALLFSTWEYNFEALHHAEPWNHQQW